MAAWSAAPGGVTISVRLTPKGGRDSIDGIDTMSDGRAVRGPLYELVRRRRGIALDLDLCARIYGEDAGTRQAFAQFARLVDEAASSGDEQARAIFVRAARELATTVKATRRSLAVPDDFALPVSYSGGVFNGSPLLVEAFGDALVAADHAYDLRTPVFAPEIVTRTTSSSFGSNSSL